MPSQYWIIIGDIHNNTDKLGGIKDLAGAAGLIVSGDLTFAGGAEAAQKVLDALAAKGRTLGAQIGNMDKGEVNTLLNAAGLNLHGRDLRLCPGLTAIGVGGSNKTPFHTPSEFSEEEIAALLEAALTEAGDYEKLLLVAHAPPLNTECDRLASGVHAGSRAVREFIERVQPDLCICGHIHEARGMDMIGNTPVVNPGSFAEGGYVRVELGEDGLEAALLLAE